VRKTRDGDDTKQRVLTAAQELFAAKGFSGTSLADISQRCGISDGLILHHFKSKKNLYQQVLENLSNAYSQTLMRAKGSAANPQEMMEKTLAASFDFWMKDETYNRISLWSSLEGQTELAQKEEQLTSGIFQEVRQLQEKGIIDNRYSPVVILTMVIGSIHFWIQYRNHFMKTLNLPGTPDEQDQLFLKQITKMVMEISRKTM
jgi:AcrR family transcriptional regulator